MTDIKFIKEDFAGKKVVVYGASIDTPAEKSIHGITTNYVDFLQKDLGFELLGNFAVSATPATHSVSTVPKAAAQKDRWSGAKYVDQYESYNKMADIAIIDYGGNDLFNGAYIGENSDDPQSWEETTTFKGAINYMVKKLRLANPKMKIILFTLLWRSDKGAIPTNNNTGLSELDFADALYDIAPLLDVKVVDCYPCFNAENFGPGLNSDDGIHPDDTGHRMFADFLLGK